MTFLQNWCPLLVGRALQLLWRDLEGFYYKEKSLVWLVRFLDSLSAILVMPA